MACGGQVAEDGGRARGGSLGPRAALPAVALAIALLVLVLSAAPWGGRGMLASAAQVWGEGRPQVHGDLTALDGGTARLTLWNGGGLPARVVVQVGVAGGTGTPSRVTVHAAGDGRRRLLYAGDLAGCRRLDIGELASGTAEVLEIAAVGGEGVAPSLQVAWTAVTGR